MTDLQLTDKADRLTDKLTCFTDWLTDWLTTPPWLLLAKWLKNITDYLHTTLTYSIVLSWLTFLQVGWLLTFWLGDWFDWSLFVWSAKRLTVHGVVLVDCWTVLRIIISFHKGCILNLSCITSSGLRKDVSKWKDTWNKIMHSILVT